MNDKQPLYNTFTFPSAIFILLLFMVSGCDEWELAPRDFPEIITGDFMVDQDLVTTVSLKGKIEGLTDDGFVNEHGHILSCTNPQPVLDDNDRQSNLGRKGNGEYKSIFENLAPGKKYYYRAYVILRDIVKYGEVEIFSPDDLPLVIEILGVDCNPITSVDAEATVLCKIDGLPHGLELQEYGIVWSTKPMPDKNDTNDEFAPEQGIITVENSFEFESKIPSIQAQQYFIRPYAEIGDSIFYGQEQKVKPSNLWSPAGMLEVDNTYKTDRTVVFTIEDKAYIGIQGDGKESRFWEYDPTKIKDPAGPLKELGAFSILSQDAVSFSIDGYGYVGTGRFDRGEGADLDTLDGTFWKYDPVNNSWEQRADYANGPIFGAVGFSIGDKGYVGLGSNEVKNAPATDSTFWEYNPITNEWKRIEDFPGGLRAFCLGFSINRKGYVGMGRIVDRNFGSDFWEFDPEKIGTLDGPWKKLADYEGMGRRDLAGFTIGNKGYVGTGWTGDNNENDFWEYDPVVNEWTRLTDYAGGKITKGIGFGINDKGYIGLGDEGSGRLGKLLRMDVWEYGPKKDNCLLLE